MTTQPHTTQRHLPALVRKFRRSSLPALFILLLLGALAACGPSSATNSKQTPTPANTPTPQATATPSGPQGLEALSPELATYASQQGDAMGVSIYDLTRKRQYTYNGDATFILASSSKVYILCAYLDMLEQQGRGPNSTERAEMTAMITQSDNNAAQYLFDKLGRVTGQSAYLQKLGITGYVAPSTSARDWGYAQLSANAMVRMLMLLQTGQTLNADDRALALDLLGRVDLGRWGVGTKAPAGAKVYMKDGWVTGPDDLWYQSSSGIVVTSGETYIISVYSRQKNYDWSKVEHVCELAAKSLV
ncbi:MAG TPA: serine hydrolase [Ktedonobacterales bacterium]